MHDPKTCSLCQSSKQIAYEYKWKEDMINIVKDLLKHIERMDDRLKEVEKRW